MELEMELKLPLPMHLELSSLQLSCAFYDLSKIAEFSLCNDI